MGIAGGTARPDPQGMRRLLSLLVLVAATALASAPQALAGGGRYSFDGGTKRQRATVTAALQASAFDWNVIPGKVAVHIAPGAASRSLPGHVWLDAGLLDSGRFAWAVVQDEFAHQVDFALFDAGVRARLTALLGAKDWCYGEPGLSHAEYGCERFASTLVWSYWQSRDNAYRPASARDESAALPPAQFRRVLGEVISSIQA